MWCMEETILGQVKRRLAEHKRHWAQIARDTGVDYSTVHRIASGRSENPEIGNVQKILDWLDARDVMLERLQSRVGA